MHGGGFKIKPHVELPRFLIQRMHQNRPDRNDFGSGCGSHQRVLQQSAPEPRAFLGIMDSEARKKHDTDGMIWRAFADPQRRILPVDASSRQRIVADHSIFPMDEIGGRKIALLIGIRKPLQPMIKRLRAAGKRIEFVMSGQLLRAGQ